MSASQNLLIGISSMAAMGVWAYSAHLVHNAKQKTLDCRVAANKSLSSHIIFVIIFIASQYAPILSEDKYTAPWYVYVSIFIMLSIGLSFYIHIFSIYYASNKADVVDKLDNIEKLLNDLTNKMTATDDSGGGGARSNVTNISGSNAKSS